MDEIERLRALATAFPEQTIAAYVDPDNQWEIDRMLTGLGRRVHWDWVVLGHLDGETRLRAHVFAASVSQTQRAEDPRPLDRD